MNQRHPLHQAFAWFFVLAYMGLIFYLSHQPSIPMPMRFPHQDKVFHFVAYFGLGTLFFYSLHGMETRRRWLWAFALAAVYGITDEIHQMYVPGRDASVLDWLADAMGAGVATWLWCKNKP